MREVFGEGISFFVRHPRTGERSKPGRESSITESLPFEAALPDAAEDND